nr:DNA phosphorothioation-associated putative methyltransferase [Chloroflexota bacterium]
MGNVQRLRTAILRSTLSRPMSLALDDGLLALGTSVLDYGCGRGGDVQRLAALGYDTEGWDPTFRPEGQRRLSDVVNLGYVVNVIENPAERAEALRDAWALTRDVLIVAARLDWDSRYLSGREYSDGILTTRDTFQKFFTQEELRAWIDGELGVRSVAAAPGIFYVFRDDARAQALLAAKVRHRPAITRRPRISEALYEANRNILDPLIAFIETRGRAPEAFELQEAAAVKDRFGSVKSALAIVRRVTGDESWKAAQAAATDDLKVYLALAAFRGRAKFTQLPPDIQLDVKYFFGSYKDACASADALLFSVGKQSQIDKACKESSVGKLTREALYVHVTALPRLTPLLRVYDGCGRALAGTVEDATIMKLNRIEPKVSYLDYPDFDGDPHPSLATSIRADLKRLDLKFKDFRDWNSPPILHRKENFVTSDYPGREEFARLTAQEEKHGLFEDTTTIGTRNRWLELVEGKGLRFAGHRLVKRRQVSLE